MTQEAWSDEQFVEWLIAHSGESGMEAALRQRRECINRTVVRLLKDQVAHWVRVDIPRAVKLAEATRAAAAFIDDPIAEALADHASALALHVAGHHAEAIESYGQAEAIYERVGEEVEAARVARAKVSPLIHLGQYGTALQVAARACEVFQRHDEAILLAQTQENIGSIYHRLDQYHDALSFYDRARDIYAARQFQPGLASVSINAANQYTALNEFERALTLYQEAQQIYETLNMPLLVNQTEYSIAWLYFQRGKFQDSLKLLAKVSGRSQELGDAIQEALCDLDLAEVYLQLNAYEEAIESARSAVEKFKALAMSYEYTKAKMYLGLAHLHRNDFSAAEQQLQEARRGFLTEGNDVFTALTNIYLSDVFTRQRDWRQALHLCTEARQIFHQHGVSAKAAYAELQLARLKLGLGDRDEAGSLCRSALQLIGEAEAPWLKYQCWHLLGNLLHQSGQPDAAYPYYVQAIEALEALRSGIRVDEFKCTFVKDKLRVYEDAVELCLHADPEKIDEAFGYAEAAKSRSLVDLLTTTRGIPSKTKEPSVEQLHHEWNRLREELDWYYNRINHYQSRSQCPAELIAKLQGEVRQREQQLSRLARRLSLEDAEYASLHTATRVDPWQVRHGLAEDEALIEYYLVNGRVQAFAFSRKEARVFNDLTTSEATAPLLQWLKFCFDQLTVSERPAPAYLHGMEMVVRQYLKKLYAALVEPLTPFLEGKKIIIVPHDFLHYVPFHALYDGHQYLIDRYEISYCPSAGVFQLCSEKARQQRTDDRVLIMGVADEATPFIPDEVATVQSLWPEAHVFLGDEATLDRLKCYAPGCRLVHLASHGVFRRDNPMFSAIKLSDGWLTFYDIFHLNLPADLVTLSACETGMNEVFPGDELFGLMRGFLYAGVPSLVVSLWVVHDRSTAQLMRLLYTGLSEGLSKRAALRQAQLGVKEEYQHPYYWAPFILMGAPL